MSSTCVQTPTPPSAVRRARLSLVKSAPLLLTLAVLSATEAHAGALIFAGDLNAGQGNFTPDKKQTGSVFHVEHATLDVQATPEGVTVQMDERLATIGTRGVALIPLPRGTSDEQVQVRLNGADAQGKLLTGKQASTLYRKMSQAMDSTALLAFAGQPVYVVRQVKLGKPMEVQVKLSQPLEAVNGLYRVSLPGPRASLARAPVGRLTLTGQIRTTQPLKTVFSPSHSVKVTRSDAHNATLKGSVEQLGEDVDFELLFAAAEDPLGLRLITHRTEGEKHGYFMLTGHPSAADEAPLPKDLTLVVDISGSMRGDKMEQVRSAASHVLTRLNPEDRFNVIGFGTEVSAFSKSLVARSDQALERARVWIDELVPLGRTNIAEALAQALSGQKADAERPRIVIFLTDGAPTAGEQDPQKILEMIPALNTSKARVFTLGVGHDVNAHLLDQLALMTDGSSEYVGEDEEIDAKVAQLYEALSHPVLAEVKIDFGGLKVDTLYPAKVPALFKGRDLVVVGRYSGGGKHTITVSGEARGQKQAFAVEGAFPKKPDPADGFVAAIWANRRVGALLEQLRFGEQDAELVAEVVQLSRRFGILTEYTRFLAQEEVAYTDEQAAERAVDLLSTANAQKSGSWAVRQADNERKLKKRMVASSTSNVYVDRQGRVQKATAMKQVGRRTFYKRKGKWVQAPAAAPAAKKPAPRRTRKVKRFSKEYMKLVEENADFAEAQSLDGAMEMNLGDERIEVE